VFAAQHLLDFTRLDLGLEAIEPLRQVGRHVLAGLRPLDQHADVVDALLQCIPQLQVLADALPALQRGLRLGLLVPEVRRADARLETAQFLVQSCGVKDNSAGRRPASAGRWSDGSDHR
jgi:hypothetical protein